MKKRMLELDFIRILGMLAVIIIHVSAAYIYKMNVAYVYNQIVRFAVPIFVILSGAVLYYKYQGNEDINVFDFYKKRFIKILIPFILWTLIYRLYEYRNVLLEIDKTDFLFGYIKDLLRGREHLYFVIIIFKCYLVYPIIKNLFDYGYEKILLILSFIVTLILQTDIYILHAFNIKVLNKLFVNNTVGLFSWIFYFILGMYIVKNKDVIKKYKISIQFILWCLCIVLLVIDSKITDTPGLSIKPMCIIYSTISFVLFYVFANKYINKDSKVLRWLSNQSFVVYLSHIMVLHRERVYIEKLGWYNIYNTYIGMELMMLVNLIVTLLLIWILSNFKISKYLGVVVKRRRKDDLNATIS